VIVIDEVFDPQGKKPSPSQNMQLLIAAKPSVLIGCRHFDRQVLLVSIVGRAAARLQRTVLQLNSAAVADSNQSASYCPPDVSGVV